jgi:hypothetical protein
VWFILVSQVYEGNEEPNATRMARPNKGMSMKLYLKVLGDMEL